MSIRTFSCIICLYSLAEKGWGVLPKNAIFQNFKVNNFSLFKLQTIKDRTLFLNTNLPQDDNILSPFVSN